MLIKIIKALVLCVVMSQAVAHDDDRFSSFLPFWSSLAEQMDADLPLPIGVSIANIGLKAPLHVKDAEAFVFGNSLLKLDSEDVKVGIVDVQNVSLRVDALVLPFLNVYGFYGTTAGNVDLDIDLTDLGNPLLNGVAAALTEGAGVISENFEFTGSTYGGGASLIAGYPFRSGSSVFLMADANYSWTKLDVLSTTIFSRMMSYRVGWDTRINNKPIQFWAGVMDHLGKQEATIPITKLSIPVLDEVNIKLNVEDDSGRTPMAGAAYQVGEHWLYVAEYRFGKRKLSNLMVSYRF
jgi:hypothetical protein